MELTFTKHPIIQPPTDEQIVLLGKNDPQLLADLHRVHEGRIQSSIDEPLKHGFDLDGWKRMQAGLEQ